MLKNLLLAVAFHGLSASAIEPRKVYIMYPQGIDGLFGSKWPKGYVPVAFFQWNVDGVPKKFKCSISKITDDGLDLKEDGLFVVQKDIPYVPMDKNGPLSMKCELTDLSFKTS